MTELNKIIKFIKNVLTLFLLNIHTIFLFVGATSIVVAAFFMGKIIGLVVLGVVLILLSIVIDRSQ